MGKRIWCVALIIPGGAFPVLGDERHLFLVRHVIDPDTDADDLIYCLVPESEVFPQGSNHFEPGSLFSNNGLAWRLNEVRGMWADLRFDEDGMKDVVQKWMLGLLQLSAHSVRPLNLLTAEIRPAREVELQ
ncbi:hypothetical protein [Mesorhizobium sp. CN2-181]|uniref:hypothetical protein n=1 Tax=Mesorhizobium yinganensis TaxID=3157707 RepID=UPI0032B78A6A